MLSYLAGYEDIFGPFRLFQYITFRAMIISVNTMANPENTAPATK